MSSPSSPIALSLSLSSDIIVIYLYPHPIISHLLSSFSFYHLLHQFFLNPPNKNKAYSSASLTLSRKEESTGAIAERMAKNAPTTVPQTPLPNVTYARGGVAIMAGGNIIGGLGVSGAPGGQFDEECARAALSKIADRMK